MVKRVGTSSVISVLLAIPIAHAEPPTPTLGRFAIGDDKALVLSKLGPDASRVVCVDKFDSALQCAVTVSAERNAALSVQGVRFANWTFAFDHNRLVSVAASAVVSSDADDPHIVMLAALAKELGLPEIKESAGPESKVIEARWSAVNGAALSFHRIVTPHGPLANGALDVLRRFALALHRQGTGNLGTVWMPGGAELRVT